MTTEQSQLRRLARVEVDRLFGIYNHRIDLALDDRVTLLHGPNGVGKTTILKMVDALLTDRLGYFRSVPFERLLLRFHDCTSLELTKSDSDGAEFGNVTVEVNGETNVASISLVPSTAEMVASEVEYLERAGGNAWVDMRDGQLHTDDEVVRRYTPRPLRSRSSAERVFAELTGDHEDEDPWLAEFLGTANSHFIEAQRLVRSHYPANWLSRQRAMLSRVVECSRELKRRIDDTMADYGRQAQSLDQSFPQRLLQRNAASGNLPVEEIRRRMSALDDKTKELKDIGILDETPHQFHLLDDIDRSQAGVMMLYVDDTEKKIQVLEDLASRARLLLTSLNGKFRHKQLRVDREEGLVVDGQRGDPLPLDSLSSGEQHELILHYDLLFRVPQNTVVLLDEPELSLHVEWQSKFLSDLMAIVKLSGFDALVATHSPYIVGDRDDLMVDLVG